MPPDLGGRQAVAGHGVGTQGFVAMAREFSTKQQPQADARSALTTSHQAADILDSSSASQVLGGRMFSRFNSFSSRSVARASTRRGSLLYALALALALAGCGFSATQAAQELDGEVLAAYVEETLEADRVPGAAVAVVIAGELAFLQAYGTDARGQPITPQTGFRLGSMSKAFTALAVMRMVERGVLQLDTPVRALLPEFRLADMAAADAITLRQLLTHTSGIPERAPRAATDASLADHVAALAEVRPAAAPGERHIYASPNYLVAARLLEVVDGRPFEEILKAEVLRPLGLNHTFVSARDAGDLLSGGHQYWFGWPLPSTLPEEPGRLATASLISSAADMARFLMFQLGDGQIGDVRVLSPEQMSAMHAGSAEGDGFRYAFGWRDTTIANTRAVEHGGILPDYRGKMIVLPDLDAAVLVLTNASSGTPLPAQPTSHRLAQDIAEYLAGADLKQPTLTLGVTYIAASVGLGLILLGQAATLVRVLLGRDRRPRQVGRAVVDVAVVGGIAVILPVLLGLDWPAIFAAMPDFTLWLVAVSVLSVATAAVRLAQRPGRAAAD